MVSGNYDPVAEARFRATVELEIRYLKEQLALVWQHHTKRRVEIAAVSDQIEGIKRRINGAVMWFALGAGGIVLSLVRVKIGL